MPLPRPIQSLSTTIAILVVLVTFAVRTWSLNTMGLAYDEAATALMARASIGEIVWFHWDAAFEHLPLWIILAHAWSKLAGQSAFALRFLPAFAGVLTVPLLWALLGRLRPNDLAWRALASTLVALSPALVLYSQEARMYALVVLLGVASVFLLLEYFDRPLWRIAIAFVLANWAMLSLQYYSVLLLVGEAVFLGITFVVSRRSSAQGGGPAWKHRTWLALTGVAVSVLPLILWMAFSPGFGETLDVVLRESAKQHIPLSAFMAGLWRDLTFGAIRWQPRMALSGFLILPVFLIGVYAAFFTSDTDGAALRQRTLPMLLILLVVLVPVATSAVLFRTLATRYILYVLPFVYTFVAYGVLWLWRLRWTFGAVAGALTIGVVVTGLAYYFGSYVKSEYREMAAYLEQRYEAGRHSVLIEAPRQHLLAKYYLGQEFPLQPIPDVPLPDYWPITAPRVVPEEVDDIVQSGLHNSSVTWLVLSAEAEVDPGEFLAKYLTAVAYKDGCEDWLDVRLCRFASPVSVALQTESKIGAEFGHELVLEGAGLGLPDQPDPSGETPLRLRLDWVAVNKPSADYKVSVRLVAEDGTAVAQEDQYPIGTLLPPTTWNAQDRKPGFVVLAVPARLPPGTYSIQAEVYDPMDMSPVPHTTPDGDESGGPIDLGVLVIGDTMRLQLTDEPGSP